MHAPQTPPCGTHVLKLCINSHVAYRVPIRTLFESLLRANFTLWTDVVVMLGGSAREAGPSVLPLAELIPGLAVERGAAVEQPRGDVLVAVPAREDERRVAVLVGEVDGHVQCTCMGQLDARVRTCTGCMFEHAMHTPGWRS